MHDAAVTSWVPTIDLGDNRARTDVAYEALSEAIFDRHFAPGGRLSIDGAAQRLGMSITPVREALTRLAGEGLIIRAANKGFTVAPLLSVQEFHALFTARRVLETEAMRPRPDGTGTTARITDPLLVPDEVLDRLRALTRQMRDADRGPTYAGYSHFTRLDGAFHQTLVELSGNRFLSGAWRGLHFHLHVSRLYAGAGVIDFEQACAEHEAIIRAAERRDGVGMGVESSEHMVGAESRLVSLLQPAQEEGQ